MERAPAGFWMPGGKGFEIVEAYHERTMSPEEAVAALRAAGVEQTVGRTDDEAFRRYLLDWHLRDLRKRGYLGGTKLAGAEAALSLPKAERTTVGQGGRIVIPAAYREALGLEEGDEVTLWLGEDELHVIPSNRVLRHVQALVRRYVPADRSLVDELIAERRREAVRE